MIVTVATINTPEKLTRAQREKCFTETAERASLFGLNEVFTLRSKRQIRGLAKEERLSQFGLFRTPNPVFYSAGWEKVAGSLYTLHGPSVRVFGRYPGYNEARYATVTLYRSKHYPGEPLVAHIHTHWVAINDKVPAKWAAAARKKSIEKVTRIVARHRAAGHHVVITGDLNMRYAPHIPGVVWISDNGVDKIGVAVAPGYRLVSKQVRAFPAPTDHDFGRVATVTISAIPR